MILLKIITKIETHSKPNNKERKELYKINLLILSVN
jgi:hypothetical protein